MTESNVTQEDCCAPSVFDGQDEDERDWSAVPLTMLQAGEFEGCLNVSLSDRLTSHSRVMSDEQKVMMCEARRTAAAHKFDDITAEMRAAIIAAPNKRVAHKLFRVRRADVERIRREAQAELVYVRGQMKHSGVQS